MITDQDIESTWPLNAAKNQMILQNNGDRLVVGFAAVEGRFIYKVASKIRSRQQVISDLQTLEHANSCGFVHVPKLLKTKDGELATSLNGRVVYVLEEVTGRVPAGTVSDWAALGSITSQLHSLPLSPTETDFTQASTVPDLINSAGKFSFKNDYIDLLKSLKPLEELPESIIHTDIGPHNAIKSSEKYVIIDWDDAGNGTRLLDISFPLICHFVLDQPYRLDEEKAAAFYKNYAKYATLTDSEINKLFSAGLFYALMYLEFGDTNRKWEMIKWSLKNETQITKKLNSWINNVTS